MPLYAHGTPGSAAELSPSPFTAPILAPHTRLTAPTHIIAFSLGAHLAITAAAAQPDHVSRLTLISPAAPLDLGDFLPHMAGRAVFRAARTPPLLRALAAVQLHLLRRSPDRFLALLFRDAPTSEHSLLSSPPHRDAILQALHDSLPTPAYRDALQAYVRPWSHLLPRVACPVTLHCGSADTWTPPAMSDALAAHLSDATRVTHPDLGHYATLYRVLDEM